jgi:hypothetical protein
MKNLIDVMKRKGFLDDEEDFEDEVIDDEEDFEDVDEELEALKRESNIARMQKPIEDVKRKQLINEEARLELKKQSGNLISYSLAEFLFLGYLDKFNNEILRMPKKIKPIIENLFNEKKPEEIVKRITSELAVILREVRDQQQNDLKKWKDSLNDD